MKSDDEPEQNASEPKSVPEAAHWGFVSGFCGADSMSFADGPGHLLYGIKVPYGLFIKIYITAYTAHVISL